MPNEKDPFEGLEIDETILKPVEDSVFDDLPEGPPENQEAKPQLQAHIRRSHKQEEDDWNYNILTTSEDRIGIKVGTKEMAQYKRNKLYNARSYLKYVRKIQYEMAIYEGPLDDWTLILQEIDGSWYVVALNTSVEHNQWKKL